MIALPTGGFRTPRRAERLLAVTAVRDDARFVAGWLRNVVPQVDGVVALDDGSTDGSGELLAAHAAVFDVIRVSPQRPEWDEVGNYRALVAAAIECGATWIVSIDCDERVEDAFRDRAERAIRRGRALGIGAFGVRIIELWDTPTMMRVDGLWERSRRPGSFGLGPITSSTRASSTRTRLRFRPAGWDDSPWRTFASTTGG